LLGVVIQLGAGAIQHGLDGLLVLLVNGLGSGFQGSGKLPGQLLGQDLLRVGRCLGLLLGSIQVLADGFQPIHQAGDLAQYVVVEQIELGAGMARG